MKSYIFAVFLLTHFSNCERLVEWGKRNARSKILPPPTDERDINKWKEKLGLEEAEIRDLEIKIRKMVRKTNEAGALSWKIARAYMKVGNFELGSRYYTQAIRENQEGKTEVIGAEVHFFESAIPYFEKALVFRKSEEDLLFETGLAFANASRDRGWDRERRETALRIFKGLSRLNPEDTRYPYQIALIYFDSSVSDGLIEGVDPEGYNDQPKALQIVNEILKKEPRSVPLHFTRANFLYRLGRVQEAEEEYISTKSLLEQLKKDGIISEDLKKNQSYQNVLKNLDKISKSRKGF